MRGLKHFGRYFDEADAVNNLGLDCSTDNRVFLKSLASAAHKMEIQVFAEGLIHRAESEVLQAVGSDGVAGPAVEESTSINPY